jgi:hypothetical protein
MNRLGKSGENPKTAFIGKTKPSGLAPGKFHILKLLCEKDGSVHVGTTATDS